MPYSDFVRYIKVARMMMAQEQLASIEASSFHSYGKEDQKRIVRNLKSAAGEYLEKQLKEFSDVAKNLAKRMMSRG